MLTIDKAGGQNIAKFLCSSRALLKIKDFMDGIQIPYFSFV